MSFFSLRSVPSLFPAPLPYFAVSLPSLTRWGTSTGSSSRAEVDEVEEDGPEAAAVGFAAVDDAIVFFRVFVNRPASVLTYDDGEEGKKRKSKRNLFAT